MKRNVGPLSTSVDTETVFLVTGTSVEGQRRKENLDGKMLKEKGRVYSGRI